MPLTVEELVNQPPLETRFLAGASGRLTRVVWAHVCELSDPWLWISQGDLLMTTGLGVPAEATEQVRYVEELAAVGAAGVAIGEDMSAPPLTRQMLERANEVGFPVLMTAYHVPFIALARAVVEEVEREQRAELDRTLRIYEQMRAATGQGLNAARLLDALGAEVGSLLYVADPDSGRSVVPGRAVPEDLSLALTELRGAPYDDRPVSLLRMDAPAATALLVPGPRPSVLVAVPQFVAAVSGAGEEPDPSALRHVAAVVALQRSWVFAQRERARRLGASLLAQVIDVRLSAEAAGEQLADRGLGDRRWVLVAGAGGEPAAWQTLHHVLDDEGIDHLMLTRQAVTYALIDDAASSLSTLRVGLPTGASIGVSDPFFDVLQAGEAELQARWALRSARDRRVEVVRHEDHVAGSLFLPLDHADSRAIARRLLGGLLDYDAEHSGVLMESLRVFLEENRSWSRTAARLHVHKQTVVYRMRRVEELTGRRLDDTADVAEVWLALRAASAASLIDD